MLLHHKVRLSPDQTPYSFGSPVGPFNPSLNEQKRAQYDALMGKINRPHGGFQGCAYLSDASGMPSELGIICAHNSMEKYTPTPLQFASKWVNNVDSQFPQANIQTNGNLSQLMMGGGGGMPPQNPCAALCSCDNDPNCTCQQSGDSQGQQCGWQSVNQDCMEPVLGGQYPSLSACESANQTGYGFWPK